MYGYYQISRVIFLILFLITYPSMSLADKGAVPFDKIVFFGDSLSDAGNLYRYTLGFLPKSPPYFDGRFSNGYLWAEKVAKLFYDKRYIGFKNYAIAGETAILHDPLDGFLPYSLSMSVSNYLWHTILQNRSTTLFIIWIGGNDYLHGASNVIDLTNRVAESIKSSIEKLIIKGGVNFLIVDLPNLSELPFGKTHPTPKILDQLCVLHNKKLKETVTMLQKKYHNINLQLFEAHELLSSLLANPEYYNKKYGIHLVNTTNGCWSTTPTFYGKAKTNELEIENKLKTHMNNRTHGTFGKTLQSSDEELKNLAHQIANTPELYEAYRLEEAVEAGLKPCDKPDEFVFWDDIHPSAVVHFMLSHRMVEFIEQHFTHV